MLILAGRHSSHPPQDFCADSRLQLSAIWYLHHGSQPPSGMLVSRALLSPCRLLLSYTAGRVLALHKTDCPLIITHPAEADVERNRGTEMGVVIYDTDGNKLSTLTKYANSLSEMYP